MKVAVITLSFDAERGAFDTEALEKWHAGKEVIEARDHFFVHEGTPRWALMLSYRELDSDPGEPPRDAQGRRRRRDWRLEVAEPDKALFDALREWRNERAVRDGMPAYVVLTNRELAEICQRRPATRGELREVRGVGEAKAGRLGVELLAVVAATPPAAEGAGDDG